MRTKHTFRLPPDLAGKLADYAARKRVPQALIVEAALAAHGIKAKDLPISMEFDSTEALLSAVEAGLGVTFVSRLAVRKQLVLGTLKLAYARELKLSRSFSLARPAGPVPRGNVAAFRNMLLAHALDATPRQTDRPSSLPKTS